jgi:hypothetical protein
VIPAAFFLVAGCGTLVQVVGDRNEPVSAARVQLIYPSFGGPTTTTDEAGFARLGDSWFNRPFWSMVPAWVSVSTASGTWTFNYPPPAVLLLDPGSRDLHHRKASQQADAAGEPQAARG